MQKSTSIEMEESNMFCHKCGHALPNDSVFCQKCGAKLIVDEVKSDGTVISKTISQIPQKSDAHAPVTNNGFKEYVDSCVQSATQYSTAEDLLKNSKPLMFIWQSICTFAFIIIALSIINGAAMSMYIVQYVLFIVVVPAA